jgi:Na+-transporting NADH:ubiquinone oxidoreductase subunit A
MTHFINKGLNIPISGVPVQTISAGPAIKTVGLVGEDIIGLNPRLLVAEGDRVRIGQAVFEDKKNPGVMFTSPAAGVVRSITRGEKRRFISLVIEVSGDDHESFKSYPALGNVSNEEARELLIRSGEWTALRTRPFSRVPGIEATASSIFVTAMDTNPLAGEPELVITNHREAFVHGLQALTRINNGPVFVCTRNDSRIPGKEITGVQFEAFSGPHPAGLAGTHIHKLDPVSANHSVWTIGYQDVISWGYLFLNGKIWADRVVAVAGPSVSKPQLYTVRRGAKLDEIVAGNTKGNNNRVVSGSVLCGRKNEPLTGFLGRYDVQVSVLPEGNFKEFLGWQKPGANKFSITRAFVGSWLKGRKFDMNTNINGSKRSMVPIGTYERVVPLDILPTQLLRALITQDNDRAQALGCLELHEEDLGLCTYVCPGKYEYGRILRDRLTEIEKEG